jgi:putative lipoic acid-binding regulatory protein
MDEGTLNALGDDEAKAVEAEARARALLEATHQFPCDYALTVIAFNSETVTMALKTVVASGRESVDHQVRESRAGKYLSHRFSVTVEGASAVLELYALVRAVEGVVTIM